MQFGQPLLPIQIHITVCHAVKSILKKNHGVSAVLDLLLLPAEESEDENFEDLGPFSCHAHRLMRNVSHRVRCMLIHFTFRTPKKDPTDPLNIAQVFLQKPNANGFLYIFFINRWLRIWGMLLVCWNFVDTPSISMYIHCFACNAAALSRTLKWSLRMTLRRFDVVKQILHDSTISFPVACIFAKTNGVKEVDLFVGPCCFQGCWGSRRPGRCRSEVCNAREGGSSGSRPLQVNTKSKNRNP